MRSAAAGQPATGDASATPGGRTVIESADGTDLAALVAAAAGGDESAWEELVVLYGRRMYAMAKSRLGDPDSAEEIVQSVFATLAQKLRAGPADQGDSRYTEQGRFESWLFRIVMNRVRDEGRRRRRRGETTVPLEFVRGDAQPVVDADARTRLNGTVGGDEPGSVDELRIAIARLDDKDAEIIGLRHHGGLSFAQIAESLGEPIGTVLARHHRALKKIKKDLESRGAGPGRTRAETDQEGRRE